jgi:hypothetical protein
MRVNAGAFVANKYSHPRRGHHACRTTPVRAGVADCARPQSPISAIEADGTLRSIEAFQTRPRDRPDDGAGRGKATRDSPPARTHRHPFLWVLPRSSGRRNRAAYAMECTNTLRGRAAPEPPRCRRPQGVAWLGQGPCSPPPARWRPTSPPARSSQLAGPIGDSFHASDATLSNALAITRLGAILALFATALADRRGRRRAILIGVVGTAFACALSAVAPTLVIFTAAQVLQRAFVNTTLIVAGIAVIEEAPEGAQAYSASMLALAAGSASRSRSCAAHRHRRQRLAPAHVAGTLTLLLAPRIAP